MYHTKQHVNNREKYKGGGRVGILNSMYYLLKILYYSVLYSVYIYILYHIQNISAYSIHLTLY